MIINRDAIVSAVVGALAAGASIAAGASFGEAVQLYIATAGTAYVAMPYSRH